MKRFKSCILILIVISMSAFSQNESSINILSLDECMQIAVENAPELKVTGAILQQAEASKERVNTPWILENLSVVGSSSYMYRHHLGNTADNNTDTYYDSYANDNNGLTVNSDNVYDPIMNSQATNVESNSIYGPQTYSSVGLMLNLPLSTMRWKSKDKVIAKALVEEKEGVHETQVMAVKNNVIMLYLQFQRASNRLGTASDNIEAQKSALTVAEKDFTDGTIDVEKYSNVKQSAIAAEDAFNDAKTNLEISYNALKIRIGQEIIVE